MTRQETQPFDSARSWTVAVVGTLALVCTFGTPYSFGVFIARFGAEYDLSTFESSTMYSLQLFTFYAGAGVVGFFASTYPSRSILLACAAIIGGLSPSLLFVESYAGLLATVSLLGGALGTVYVVLAAVIPQWFRDRRGVATGLLFSGIGASLFVLPSAWRFAFDTFGVQYGYAILLSLTATSCLFAGVICERPPWIDHSSNTRADRLTWVTTLVRTRLFQLYFIGIGLAFGWYYLLTAYSLEFFVHRGLTETAATITFGLIGGISILSRLGSGLIADRTDYYRTFVASLGCVVVGSVALLFPSLPALFLAVLFLGVGFGGISTMYIPLLIQSFGSDETVALIGIFNVTFGVFALALPPLGIVLVTRSDSYLSAVLLTVAVSAGALCCIVLTRSRHERGDVEIGSP